MTIRESVRPVPENLRRAIGRSVVDDQQLEAGEVPRDDAFDGLADEPLAVENEHENGHAWIHGLAKNIAG